MYSTGNYKIGYTRPSYITIIFILDIINDNNYYIDNEKEILTENSTNIIVNSYNECEEKQSSSNGKYFKSTYKTIFLNFYRISK